MELRKKTENASPGHPADGEWTAYELSKASLGDKRLNWRRLDATSKLAARPGVSIKQACDAPREHPADTFAHARQLDTDLLIRAAQNRVVCEPEIGLLWPVTSPSTLPSARGNQPATLQSPCAVCP